MKHFQENAYILLKFKKLLLLTLYYVRFFSYRIWKYEILYSIKTQVEKKNVKRYFFQLVLQLVQMSCFTVRKLFKHGKAWKNKFLSYTFSKQES